MSKTNKKLAAASVLAAGLGAAYFTKKKNDEVSKKKQQAATNGYRNTERGRYDKNGKGIYYSNGNYKHLHARKNQTALMRKMPIS